MSSKGGHDRHIYMSNGHIYARVWPGATYRITKQAGLNDDRWHSFIMTCRNGQKCQTKIDNKLQNQAPIDHSNFDWADRIHLGYTQDRHTWRYKG